MLTPHGEKAGQTYLRIRDLIVRGRLAPGVRAAEARLSEKLGVSRTPIREALARLALEGYLVAATAGRRTEWVVAQLLPDAVNELWQVIGALEGIAIRGVSALGRDRRRALAAAMAEVNDALETAAACRPRNVELISQLQMDVHTCFMDACAGPQLRSIYDVVRPHVHRYGYFFDQHAPRSGFAKSIAEHTKIIDAVGRGDGDTARRLIEEHWVGAAARTAALIQRCATPGRSRKAH